MAAALACHLFVKYAPGDCLQYAVLDQFFSYGVGIHTGEAVFKRNLLQYRKFSYLLVLEAGGDRCLRYIPCLCSGIGLPMMRKICARHDPSDMSQVFGLSSTIILSHG